MIDNDSFIDECRDYLHRLIDERFLREDRSPMYDDLLLGFQKAGHPVFNKIPEIIPEHLRPSDFLPGFSTDNGVGTIELSVISFAFIFNKRTVEENSSAVCYPSFSWYKSTDMFLEFTSLFREFIKGYFKSNEFRCVFPNTIKEKYRIIWKNRIKYSTWSERHIAYACGLGSFGLHGSLITKKGCSHRLMSMVIDQEFKRYDVPDQPWNKNCLSANNIQCGKCIKKCPVNSISTGSRSIVDCLNHESIENKEAAKRFYGKEMEACGLCMAGVPCSTINPMKEAE